MIEFNEVRKEMEWGGRKLILETGKISRQAAGSVVVTYGETIVHGTVCAAKEVKADQDFCPLTVNYQEKYYATGKVPGGFGEGVAGGHYAGGVVDRCPCPDAIGDIGHAQSLTHERI